MNGSGSDHEEVPNPEPSDEGSSSEPVQEDIPDTNNQEVITEIIEEDNPISSGPASVSESPVEPEIIEPETIEIIDVIEKAVSIEEEEEEEDPIEPLLEGITAQLAYEISVPALLTITSAPSVELVPQSYYADLRSQGISWLILTDFPESANLSVVEAIAASKRLKVAVKYPEGFLPDTEFGDLLRSGNVTGFQEALEALSPDEQSRLIHTESPRHDCEIPMALLALPGLKVLRGDDRELRRIFGRDEFLNGTFSFPEVRQVNGIVIAWKYTGINRRLLVCVNPTDQRGIAEIPCPEAPDPISGDKIDVPELIMDSTFRRDPAIMRTKGLFVILHGGEVQIFEY